MTSKNKYVKRAKISEAKFRLLIRYPLKKTSVNYPMKSFPISQLK